MVIARQSTARTVMVGPVLDADGVAVTDGVVADFKLSKNGGAPAALNGSATLTHRHTGFYSLALTASDLDTVGQAEVTIDDTVNACPTKEITVIEEAVYDAMFAASAVGPLLANSNGSGLTEAGGDGDHLTAINLPNQTMDIVGNITGNLSGSVGSVTGAVGSVAGAVGSVTGAVGSVTGNIGGNLTGSVGSLAAQAKADVNAEADTALSDYDPPTRAELTTDTNSILSKLLRYVQLVLRKDAAIGTDNATEVTAINADGGSGAGAFANTTDSQEAIRDRGDAAWTTGAGGSAPTVEEIADEVETRTIAAVTTAGSVTGSVGSVTGNVGGNVVGSVGSVTAGVTLAASAVQAIWDALTSALTTVGSIGKLLVDNINATISSRLATAGYTAPPSAATTASAVRTELGTELGRIDAAVSTRATPAQVATELGTYDAPTKAELDAAVAALATAASLSTAQTAITAIKAVTDLLTAAQSEPSAAPAANATPLAKLAFLAAMARNKSTLATDGSFALRNDGDTADILTRTDSDDGTTYTRGEVA